MRSIQQFRIIILLLTLVLAACGSGSSDQSELDNTDNTDNTNDALQFQDRWTLTDYSLEDGTVVSVPDYIQDDNIGINVSRADSMLVKAHLCETYMTSYVLDNGVLTTGAANYPPESCGERHDDFDAERRSTFLRGVFANSQTIIVISGDVLSVTTVGNAVLNFKR